MTLARTLSGVATAALTVLAASDAAATARTGGVISLVGGGGACNVSQYVPLDTSQDSFALAASTGCNGTSASADMYSSAATASVGLKANSSGTLPGSSQVSAQVYFTDNWILGVPAGTAPRTFVVIPVSLRLDGFISPGAVSGPGYGRHLDYGLTIRDAYTVGLPTSILAANGSISTDGAYSQTFSGNVGFYYWGPGSLETKAEVTLNLYMPGLFEGAVDFYHTASISMDLPPGFTAMTSSGIPLVFAPVPEPASALLLTLGALGLVCRERFSRKAIARK